MAGSAVLCAFQRRPWSETTDFPGLVKAHLTDFSGVKQQKRVPGRRCIEDDKALCAGIDFPRESTEYRDLLGARRTRILFQQSTRAAVSA